jgi:hypothetical protein
MLEICRFFFRKTKWYKIHEDESRERFFPKLRVQNSKEVVQDKEIGTKNDVEYYWFAHPNLHQYQERLKITGAEIVVPFSSQSSSLALKVSLKSHQMTTSKR